MRLRGEKEIFIGVETSIWKVSRNTCKWVVSDTDFSVPDTTFMINDCGFAVTSFVGLQAYILKYVFSRRHLNHHLDHI